MTNREEIIQSIGIEQMIRDYADRYYDIEGQLNRNFCDICLDKMSNEPPCDLDTAIQKNCPFRLFCLNDDEIFDMWLNSEKEDDQRPLFLLFFYYFINLFSNFNNLISRSHKRHRSIEKVTLI